MQSLNEDTRFEVFDTIAELVDDGVFILMSVCTDWQAQVLRSPRLWRYITLSNNIDDLEAKLHTQIAISQGLPLVVRAHFPFSLLHGLEEVLANAIDCFMVANPLIEPRHDRTFDILRKILLQYPLHQIASIMWRDSNGYHPYTPDDVIQKMCDCARLNDVERFDRFLQRYPASLLSCFDTATDVDWCEPDDEPRTLLVKVSQACFRKLTHLVSLTVDPNFYAEASGEICNFPTIQNLDIKLLQYSPVPLGLFTTNLRRLILYGSCVKILDCLTTPELALQLEKFTLQPYWDEDTVDSHINQYQVVRFPRHCISDLVFDVGYAWRNGIALDSVITLIQILTRSLQITRLHIYIRSEHLVMLRNLRIDHHVHTFQVSDALPRDVDKLSQEVTCETLILRNAMGDPQFDGLPRPQTLILINTQFAFSDIPSSWARTLSVIQVEKTWERPLDIGNGAPTSLTSRWSSNPRFAVLRSLRCEVRIIIQALSSNYQFAVLEELHISKGDSSNIEDVNYKEKIQLLALLTSTICTTDHRPTYGGLPKLHTLAFDWFPEWMPIQLFLELWTEAHAPTSILTLRLPKRPANQLLAAIVRLLNGVPHNVAINGLVMYDSTTECRDCALAGWISEGDCEARHGVVPMTELFTITKDTYY